MSGLTQSQIDQFFDRGYTMKHDVFTASELQPLRDELSGVVDSVARRLFVEGKLSQLYEGLPFERRLTFVYKESEEIYKVILGTGGGGHSGRAMFDIIRHPKMLACIESLVGPEVVGSSVYRVRPKIPGMPGGVVPWHQDSGYFLPHCDKSLIVTCWLPLVDATAENGCLEILVGAHRQGVARHYTGGHAGFLEIPEEELPEGEAVTVPVPLGGAIFFTNLTPHRSTENGSDVVRWSIDLRYQGPDVPSNVDRIPEEYDINAPDGEIACYPPEADFIIRSPSHPEREVTSWEAFHEIRQRYENSRVSFPRMYGPKRGWISMAERTSLER